MNNVCKIESFWKKTLSVKRLNFTDIIHNEKNFQPKILHANYSSNLEIFNRI